MLQELNPEFDPNLATNKEKNTSAIVSGIVGTATRGAGVALLGLALSKLVRMLLDICRKSVKGINDPAKKKYKYYQCQVTTIKKIIFLLDNEKIKCKSNQSCKDKYNKHLNLWKNRLIEKEKLFAKYKRS